jgi:predicted CoA-substrate-specific enzyme activase
MAIGNNIYVAGVDVGSLTTKVVIMDRRKATIASEIIRSGHDAKEIAKEAMNRCLNKVNLKMENLSYVVGTGYGRVQIPFASTIVTEISCQAKGVHYLIPNVTTIVDVGGQDSKAISVGTDGSVVRFVLNDKCAAGTGRFFEVMSSALEVPLEGMGNLAVKAVKRSHISNTCTIFAESEIIGLMVNGTPKDWIIAGLCESIAIRLYGMLAKLKTGEYYVMTGGVAKNIGVVKILGEIVGKEFLTPPEPQLTAAIGGALIGLTTIDKR